MGEAGEAEVTSRKPRAGSDCRQPQLRAGPPSQIAGPGFGLRGVLYCRPAASDGGAGRCSAMVALVVRRCPGSEGFCPRTTMHRKKKKYDYTRSSVASLVSQAASSGTFAPLSP
ncbi:hypothetical protein CDD81_1822 [Ophiocordyceps australis]|uniref:Uncharacterized protein n=1 Tax=Ophiocordyceps australis TaxID=1399860 RepID=A0A2C5XV56_9HYPO|nr:hypothetical protein CDD81_1822 [Ophiocordyceps australis]